MARCHLHITTRFTLNLGEHMPFKTFVTGDSLPATDLNSYFMNQVVASCVSTARPSGTTGQMIAETDTNLFKVYTGAGWVTFGGFSGWQTWSGTIGGIGGTATFVGKFQQIGKLISAYGKITVSTYASNANTITLTLPATPASSIATNTAVGSLLYSQAAGTPAKYTGAVLLDGSTTTATFMVNSGSSGAAITWKGNAPTQFSTDTWTFSISYEAA